MMSTKSTRALYSDPTVEPAADARPFVPVSPLWTGFLHEFRNHLTVLMAATSEIRAEIPPAVALRVGDAIFETERNVQGLTSLVALMDASVRTAEPVIAPLGDVVDRALRLAKPSVGRRVSIVSNVPRAAGVRNRGSALEGLLAALIVDLAKSHANTGAPLDEPCASPTVRLEADAGRRGFTIEVACDGAALDPASWRFALASAFADKLDATLSVAADATAYVVQFR
jgi:hypothetical protein